MTRRYADADEVESYQPPFRAVWERGDGEGVTRVRLPDKIRLIKAVRTVAPGTSLKQAKDAVEGILRSITVEYEERVTCEFGCWHTVTTVDRLDSDTYGGRNEERFPVASFMDAILP